MKEMGNQSLIFEQAEIGFSTDKENCGIRIAQDGNLTVNYKKTTQK